MELQVGMAKVGKYAVGSSGDSVEFVERPRGGLSMIVVDGQGHGPRAKVLSHQVANKAAGLIADGARDGAVLRAVNDYLYSFRGGVVSATVTVISADLEAESILVCRNSNSPVVIGQRDGSHCLDSDVAPIGVRRLNKPAVSHWPLAAGSTLVAFTDGVIHAGRYGGAFRFSLDYVYEAIHAGRESNSQLDPEDLAAEILDWAVQAEQGRPRDDMVVAVMCVADRAKGLGKRLMRVTYPY